MVSLKWLDLSHTELGDPGLQQLAALTALRQLTLFDTRVTERGIAAFRQRRPDVLVRWSMRRDEPQHRALVNLRRLGALYHVQDGRRSLSLFGTDWTGGNQGLAILREVTDVDLLVVGHWQGLDASGLQAIQRCQSVRQLWLSSTGIADRHLTIISKMTQLTELELSEPGITDTGVSQLAALPNLERLALILAPNVTAKSLPALANCRRLSALNLEYCGFADADLSQLLLLPGLRELELHGNFTPAAIDALVQLKQLRKLIYMPYEQPTEEQWQRLKDGLPNCELR